MDTRSYLQVVKDQLREKYHLKEGTDYALVHKPMEVHIVCASENRTIIQTVFDTFGVRITTMHTY